MGDGEREGMQETLLSEIERVAGERKFTARAFAELLGSGAEATTVSLIPQYADAVFVGDATQSKFARVKVLFLTGLTDVLPLTSADTAVITDGEISRLSELQVEIEPAIATVNARARESLALNMCNFTEALYASYPLRVGGAESVKGEAYEYLTKLFAPVGREDDETLLLARCRTRTRAVLKLLSYKTDIEEGRSRDRRSYAALYAALKEEDRAYLDKVFSAGIKQNITCGEKLYFEWGSVSPTLLESYFGCPYAGFSERGLKLRRREERAVFDADAGIFVHKVLQIVAGKLNDFTGEEDCRSFAKTTAERLLLTPAFASLTDTQSGKYTGERLVEESAKASVVSYLQLKASRFRVAGVEQKLTDPELGIGGQTDRIDETDKYVRIFDYKSGSTDSYDKPSNYYTGRKLQLELYLRTASGDKKPAGAFYFPAADSFSKTEEEKYRLIGFYNGEDEVVALHDSTLEEGEKSSFFEGTRGGKLTDKGMSGEDFERFLDYAALVSVKAEHEMKEGNVAPSPYKGVCLYCKYKGMCGYDGDPRREESVKCSDIVRIVKIATGEEE